DTGSHDLHPAESRRPAVDRGRHLPPVQHLGLADDVGRFVGGGGGAHGHPALRQANQVDVRPSLFRLRVEHENGGRRHEPILARSWSSNAKSTGRSWSPADRYHCHVCANPDASVWRGRMPSSRRSFCVVWTAWHSYTRFWPKTGPGFSTLLSSAGSKYRVVTGRPMTSAISSTNATCVMLSSPITLYACP